jgi:hypothetical protein
MCGCDGSVTSGEVSVDHVVHSAGIAADLHTVIARVGAIRHDGIVCRAARVQPRECSAWAAGPARIWPGVGQPRASHTRKWAATRAWWVVTAAEQASQVRPPGLPGSRMAGFIRPPVTAGLPAAAAMSRARRCIRLSTRCLADSPRRHMTGKAQSRLDLWRAVTVGDDLRTFEGARVCGHATVG